jgi:hypothetical protein
MQLKSFRAPLAALLATCMLSMPLEAAAPKTQSKSAEAAKSIVSSPPNLDAVMALMDKLFPPQPDPDPARLALARTSVQAMWPDGAYGKLMTGFLSGMVDRVMQLKASDLADLSGKAEKASASRDAKNLSLHDTVAGKDPYFDQRMAAMRGVLDEEVGKVSLIIDPRMREGMARAMARAMARRFDAQQLAEINSFFATPSGRAFAGQYMQLWFDPDTIHSLSGSMPEMMKLMPEMMQKFEEANAKFPKAPAKDTANH